MKDRTKRKRRTFSQEERESHVEGWRLSGLSAETYGERVGVRAANLTRWRRESASSRSEVAPAFRELSLHDGDATRISAADPEREGPLLELCLPSGLRLMVHRQVEATWLKEVIQAVGEVQR